MNKTNPVHPLIDALDVSLDVKQYFTALELYEIIEDKVVLSSESLEINECRENHWSFGVDLKNCNAHDIEIFFKAIINARSNYLVNHDIHTKMIFYTWYDSMAGCFNFSIIPENWPKLEAKQEFPFGCTVNKVNKLENIISNFINDPVKGVIPMEDLKDIDPSEDENSDNDSDIKENSVDVWSTVL